jgi:hypothetical protein
MMYEYAVGCKVGCKGNLCDMYDEKGHCAVFLDTWTSTYLTDGFDMIDTVYSDKTGMIYARTFCSRENNDEHMHCSCDCEFLSLDGQNETTVNYNMTHEQVNWLLNVSSNYYKHDLRLEKSHAEKAKQMAFGGFVLLSCIFAIFITYSLTFSMKYF